MSKIALLILAAGSSSRMGKIKQLLPFKNTSLLGNAILQAKKCEADEVFVVLGANSEKIKSGLKNTEVVFVENPEWEKGIGTSISAGINKIQKASSEYQAVLILLADQPLINSSYLNKLLNCFRKNPGRIIATKYPHSHGVPALFPQAFFDELIGLEGDEGAKSILQNKSDKIIPFTNEEGLIDIDTPEDYIKIFQSRLFRNNQPL